MRDKEGAIRLVKAELCEELDRITAALPRLSGLALAGRIAAVQRKAVEFGLVPLADVAQALGTALTFEARSPLFGAYLAAMRDAAGCTRADAAAGEAYLASINVRLAH